MDQPGKLPKQSARGLLRIQVVRWLVSFVLAIAVANLLEAAPLPLTLKDVSLMLRSGYSSEAVMREVEARKFADTLDPGSKKQLLQAGATEMLIATLRSGSYQATAAEIAALKQQAVLQSQQRIAASRSANPATVASSGASSPAITQRGGNMYDHLKDDLIYVRNGAINHFDDEALANKKFYLLFFSASWSPEGQKLTQELIDYYNRVSREHSEFEIIFFGADRSRVAMENYMRKVDMPWPAVEFDKLSGKAGAMQSTLVHQIPALVLADASGKVLCNSSDYKDSGPEEVLADLDKILTGGTGQGTVP